MLTNKMLQTIKPPSRPAPLPPAHAPSSPAHAPSSPLSPHRSPRKVINLSFHPARNSPLSRSLNNPEPSDRLFKTFYQSDSHRRQQSQLRYARRSTGQSSLSERQTIVGTPFVSVQFNQKEIDSPVLPLMDRERYRYLLKAISTINRGNPLAEMTFGAGCHLPTAEKIPKKQEKVEKGDHALHQFRTSISKSKDNRIKHAKLAKERSLFLGESTMEASSPRVINLSPDFNCEISPREKDKDNPFMKMFKNKRKLQSKYWHKEHMIECGDFEVGLVSLVGEEELKINQVFTQEEMAQHKLKQPAPKQH